MVEFRQTKNIAINALWNTDVVNKSSWPDAIGLINALWYIDAVNKSLWPDAIGQ